MVLTILALLEQENPPDFLSAVVAILRYDDNRYDAYTTKMYRGEDLQDWLGFHFVGALVKNTDLIS